MTLQTAGDVVRSDLEAIADRTAEELRRLEGSSLLLVGGGGFLGHYLVQAIVHWNAIAAQAPISLTVFDNWSRGVPRWLDSTKADEHVRLVTADITQPLPADTGHHEWVIHAASIASPTFYRQHPIETMDANVDGLRRLLDHVLSDPDQRLEGFLFFSTSEIYGDPTPGDIPTPETYRGNVSCTGPRACYDESKRYGETLCTAFASVHGVPTRIARPFNNYGPGLKITDRRVLPDFARDVFAGRDITLLSSGAPTRTFCYITDAISGYFKVLVRGRDGEPYNIGTAAPEISMADLAHRVVDLARTHLGYEGDVVLGTSDDPEYLVDNPNRRCPDITKARIELDYEPAVGIDDGLQRTLLWYRDNQTAEDR